MHVEASRLFALDEALRAEADRMLADSGIGAILSECGYTPVGSYVMRTMTWRDLDFERYEDEPDWSHHWDVGTGLAKTGWCVRLQCVDHFRDKSYHPGLYWGLLVREPGQVIAGRGDPAVWKIDIWSLPPALRAGGRKRRDTWMSSMTEERRAAIIAIKHEDPEYKRSVSSVDVYEAVIEHGVSDVESFRRWWEREHGSQA